MNKKYEIIKLWRKNNPDKHASQKRRYGLKKKYGITENEYNEMFLRQNGRCKICMKISERKLDVDHAHETGVIRGLLCNQCNQALGLFQDNPLIIKSALEYIGGVA